MAIPNLVRVQDKYLGVIYTAPSSPVTFTSANGPTQLFAVDGASLPDGALLDPWPVKYQIQSFQLNNPLGLSREYLEPYHRMDMEPQYSNDGSNWTSFDSWSVNPHDGMTGRMNSDIKQSILPQYMRVVAQLRPDSNGDTTATIIMGYENYLL